MQADHCLPVVSALNLPSLIAFPLASSLSAWFDGPKLASWVLVERNMGHVASSPVGQLQAAGLHLLLPDFSQLVVSLESGRIGVAPKWYGLGRAGIQVVSGSVQ